MREAGEQSLPCAPFCTADKAAVYEALQADLTKEDLKRRAGQGGV